MARTTLLKSINANASKALQMGGQPSRSSVAVSMQSDASVIIDGKFTSAAVVTVISENTMSDTSMLEMRAAVSAAFRSVFLWSGVAERFCA